MSGIATGQAMDRAQTVALRVAVMAVYAFLLGPILLIVLAALNTGEILEFPPRGLSPRWLLAIWRNDQFTSAILTSLRIAAIATVISGAIGTAAALFYVRFAGRWRGPLRLLLLAPLLLPEILTAIALLFFFGQMGVRLGDAGLQLGHVLVTLPFVFLNVSASLAGLDPSVELAARGLGANVWTAFRRITLPLIVPGLFAGCMFAFIVSFDLFAMSLLLKGVGEVTLPVQLYQYLQWDFDPMAAAVATLNIVVTFGVVLVVDRTVGLRAARL